MPTQRANDEADIRGRIDKWAEAIRDMNLDGVMSIYAPGIVSFDLVPPLRYVGTAAKRKAWTDVFTIYERPLAYEIRDLGIAVGGDLAYGHGLNHISGHLKNGHSTDSWLRWTTCFRKIDGIWLIVHEQISVPVDMESGRAMLDLQP